MNLSQRSGNSSSGKKLLYSLLTQSQPVTDATALLLFEYLAQTVNDDDDDDDEIKIQLGGTWERAANSHSRNNGWVYKAWFETKFRKGHYKEAKQVGIIKVECFCIRLHQKTLLSRTVKSNII